MWSLGVVIYEMVTGRLPFEGEREDAVAYSIVHQEPEPITAQRVGVPTDLDRIVGKAMAKSPEERYQHVDEMLVDLRGLQKEQQAEAATAARPAPAPTRSSHRTPWLLAGAAVLVTLAVTVGAFLGLFESEKPVAQEPLRAVPFTTYPGEEIDPDFSPDGEQVVFSWDGENQDNPDIYVKRLESDTPVRLTSHAASDIIPAWSPDGRWIAFQRWEDGQGSVLLMPSIGGPERKLTDLDSEAEFGSKMAWLPDSTGLIVPDGRPRSIFVVSIETGERRILVAAPDVGYIRSAVVLSPDGQTLAFNGGESSNRRIQLLDLGADFEPIAAPRMMGSAGLGRTLPLAWSPDGSSLIVGTVRGMTGELGRLSIADPDRIQPLAFAGPGSEWAAVSARANRLVFGRYHWDWNLGVLRKSAAETELWEIGSFPSSTRLESGPQFSPDGKQLVFESDRSGNLGIWISHADGSGAKELWVVEGVASGMPRWSPDGRRVAFDTTAGGNFNIEVISSSGGSPLPVTDDPGKEQIPSWSADGNWVYFSSDRSGRPEIFRISATGGEPEQITEGGGVIPFESPDGRFVYFLERGLNFAGVAGSSPLWKVPTGGGEKSLVLERVWARNYALSRRGVYFIEPPPERGGPFAFKFLDSASGNIQTLAVLPLGVNPGHSLTVSPDEQTIVYTYTAASGTDLMLVENFR